MSYTCSCAFLQVSAHGHSCTQGTGLGPPHLVQYGCWYGLTSLTARWAPLLRAVCGLTFWNIKDFLRNREVEIVQLREKFLRGMPVSVHTGIGLCMCACMGLKGKQRSKPPWPHTGWCIWSENYDSETPIAITGTSSLAAEGYSFYIYNSFF